MPDFLGDALRDPAVHRHAAKVRLEPDGNADENALDPQEISVQLADGSLHVVRLPHVYGHPAVPLTTAENDEKFHRCWGYASPARPAAGAARLAALVADIEQVPDVGMLVRTLAGRD